MASYTFELKCPRCKKESSIEIDKSTVDAPINCGDCLMNDVEIVEMTIVRVEIDLKGRNL
jgi:transcription elongation factor Elf1